MEISRLINRYYPMVRKLAWSKLGSENDANDVCQEVFLKAFESAGHFQSEEHFKFWLVRVTINCCARLRRSGWCKNIVFMNEAIEGGFRQEEKFSYMDNYFFDSEIMETVNTLPQKYADVLSLYYFKGYSIKEIMALRQMNQNTVKSQLSRARTLLRDCLEGKRYVTNKLFQSLHEEMKAFFAAYREYARKNNMYQKPPEPGKRAAVLCIDLANGWTRPNHPFSCDADDAVNHCVDICDQAREVGVPCLFSRTIFRKSDNLRWLDKMPATGLSETDYWNCIDDRMRVRQNEPVFVKNTISALKAPLVVSYLQHLRVNTLIITGVTASGAIRHTVMDAISRGYRVIVPREAVADRIVGAVEWNLFDIGLQFGNVLSSQNVLEYMKTCKNLQDSDDIKEEDEKVT